MATLNGCRSELRSIINELHDIGRGIKIDFSGIGQDLAGNCVDKVTYKYDDVMKRLNNVSLNKLASWALR